MVSWGYAFKRGFVIWLWSIAWGIVGIIVGGVVAFIFSGGFLLDVISNPSAYTTLEAWLGATIWMFVAVLIGVLIATVGNYATIVKKVLDSVENIV